MKNDQRMDAIKKRAINEFPMVPIYFSRVLGSLFCQLLITNSIPLKPFEASAIKQMAVRAAFMFEGIGVFSKSLKMAIPDSQVIP